MSKDISGLTHEIRSIFNVSYQCKDGDLCVIQNFNNCTFEDCNIDRIVEATFNNCVFIGCGFANGLMNGVEFINCKFIDCDPKLARRLFTDFTDCIYE